MSVTVRRINIEANVGWKVFQSPTSKKWVAICDDLNLSVEGEDEVELRSLIPEAMHLLMTDLLEDNELDQYLREKGWQAAGLPQGPDGPVEFDVPWHILAKGAARDPERRSH